MTEARTLAPDATSACASWRPTSVPQAWKRNRLIELGYGIPEWLRLVPVDFESGESWWQASVSGANGSDPASRASR